MRIDNTPHPFQPRRIVGRQFEIQRIGPNREPAQPPLELDQPALVVVRGGHLAAEVEAQPGHHPGRFVDGESPGLPDKHARFAGQNCHPNSIRTSRPGSG